MKLLAVGRPADGVDAQAAIAAHARDELRALWSLYASGSVREMYSPARPGAVLVLEVASIDDARTALSELPLVANRIIEFELTELRPFTALGSLFSGQREDELD